MIYQPINNPKSNYASIESEFVCTFMAKLEAWTWDNSTYEVQQIVKMLVESTWRMYLMTKYGLEIV